MKNKNKCKVIIVEDKEAEHRIKWPVIVRFSEAQWMDMPSIAKEGYKIIRTEYI